MKNYSHLSIDRPVLEDASSTRLTAKLSGLATEILGHDNAAATDSDGSVRVVGNPNFRLLLPLHFNLLYRSGLTDSRNKASSFGIAADKLENSQEFYDELIAVYAMYDGIGPEEVALYFDAVAGGDKPGYKVGETQIDLLPSLEQPEAGFLARESQVCSRGLFRVASRIAQIQSPHINSVPLIRLDPELADEDVGKFIKEVKRILPVRLSLGELSIDGLDRRSRAINPQRLGTRL